MTLKSRRWIALTCGLLFTALMAAFYIARPHGLWLIDNAIFDALLKTRPAIDADHRVVVVDLDEKSLARYGQWPWPRSQVALLLEKIRRAQPAVVGLDILFAERDRTSAEVLDSGIALQIADLLGSQFIPRTPQDSDRVLAQVLSQGSFVLGYEFLFSGGHNQTAACLVTPLPIVLKHHRRAAAEPLPLFLATGVICPLPKFAEPAAGMGFFNVVPDPDGVQRRVPLLIAHDGGMYPGLGLAVALQLLGSPNLILNTTAAGADSLRISGTRIPLDANGNLLISYRTGDSPFPFYSAADILEEHVSPGEFSGKVVLVGTSAAGLEKKVITPLGKALPGIEVHALTIDSLLRNDFIARPATMRGVELLLLLALGVVSSLVFGIMRLRISLLFLVLTQGVLWSAPLVALNSHGLFFSPFSAALTQGGLFALLVLLRFVMAERHSRHSTRELVRTQNFMLQSLASLAEIRDTETGGHILRTQNYLKLLCYKLSDHPRFQKSLDEETIDLLFRLAPLHDIGKVGIPDNLLRKPGPLSKDEFEQIKNHVRYGLEALQKAEDRVGLDSDRILKLAKDLVYSHHEWWDGNGYPEGLRGETIPLAGRLMTVVDVYDALISKRIYKEAIRHEEALAIIAHGRGSQFDPDIVDAFLASAAEIKKIASNISDQTRSQSPISD